MTKWQQIEKRTKETKRALKNCSVNSKYIGCGFKLPIINGSGECSGCYDPDIGEMETQCRECRHNEYFIEEDVTC